MSFGRGFLAGYNTVDNHLNNQRKLEMMEERQSWEREDRDNKEYLAGLGQLSSAMRIDRGDRTVDEYIDSGDQAKFLNRNADNKAIQKLVNRDSSKNVKFKGFVKQPGSDKFVGLVDVLDDEGNVLEKNRPITNNRTANADDTVATLSARDVNGILSDEFHKIPNYKDTHAEAAWFGKTADALLPKEQAAQQPGLRMASSQQTTSSGPAVPTPLPEKITPAKFDLPEGSSPKEAPTAPIPQEQKEFNGYEKALEPAIKTAAYIAEQVTGAQDSIKQFGLNLWNGLTLQDPEVKEMPKQVQNAVTKGAEQAVRNPKKYERPQSPRSKQKTTDTIQNVSTEIAEGKKVTSNQLREYSRALQTGVAFGYITPKDAQASLLSAMKAKAGKFSAQIKDGMVWRLNENSGQMSLIGTYQVPGKEGSGSGLKNIKDREGLFTNIVENATNLKHGDPLWSEAYSAADTARNTLSTDFFDRGGTSVIHRAYGSWMADVNSNSSSWIPFTDSRGEAMRKRGSLAPYVIASTLRVGAGDEKGRQRVEDTIMKPIASALGTTSLTDKQMYRVAEIIQYYELEKHMTPEQAGAQAVQFIRSNPNAAFGG